MSPDARGLIADAMDRLDTLAVEIFERSNAGLMGQAWGRAGLGSSVWMLARNASPQRPTDTSLPPTPVEACENLRRVWWRKPDCLRDEVFSGAELLGVNIYRGTTSLSYAAALGVLYTNDPSVQGRRPPPWARVPLVNLSPIESELEQIHLLCPPFRHAGWGIEVVGGEHQFAGRLAFSIEARRLHPAASSPNVYWDGFDLFTATIDAKHGLPLRIAAIVDEEEAASYTVRSIQFNEPIPDEFFAFEPPVGTLVVHVSSE